MGLLLLFLDLPAKAAVYSFDEPVSLLAQEWSVRPPPRASYLNVYYEIIDAEMPTGIRNRTYYLGVMYRIGFEAIYLSSVSLAVLTVAVVFPSLGTQRDVADMQTFRWIFVAAAAIQVFAILVTTRARYYENKGKGRNPAEHLWRELRTEVPLPDRLLLLAGVGATIWYAVEGSPRWTGAVGIAIPAVVWALRYFFGVQRPPEDPPPTQETREPTPRSMQPERQNLHAYTAVFLFGLASFSLCIAGAVRASTPSPLSTMSLLGWLALTLVVTSLLGFRQHEKRLLGSYGIQRTWLNRKQAYLIRQGYFRHVDDS